MKCSDGFTRGGTGCPTAAKYLGASLVAPWYTTCPSASSSTSSNTSYSSDDGEWIVQMTVRCSSCVSVRSSFPTRSALTESSPVVGSSSSRIIGLLMSSDPMFVRFFSPPLTPLISPGIPSSVSAQFVRLSRSSIALTASVASAAGAPLRSRYEKVSASRGVSLPITMSSCATNDTSGLYRARKSTSFRYASPSSVCCSFTASRPATAFRNVDLPAPDGPITASERHRRAVPLTPFSSGFFAGLPSSPVTVTVYRRLLHVRSTDGWSFGSSGVDIAG
mmetsp:Transcript_39572/g.122383  ORF Transcript_39572/g.122383 Transcript_39572/m.122383 type:complete len:277 (-) Transcript_39572:54-884(-)